MSNNNKAQIRSDSKMHCKIIKKLKNKQKKIITEKKYANTTSNLIKINRQTNYVMKSRDIARHELF